MAWMKCEGDTGRTVWLDRMNARPKTDTVTRRRRGEWVVIPAKREPMTDWRRGSSMVTTEDAR